MTAAHDQDTPRLAGAQTTHGERMGIEEISITWTEGALQLEQTVAPAGEVRIVFWNRGESPVDLRLSPSGADAMTATVAGLEPGGSHEAFATLEAGEYEFSGADDSTDASAHLTVQPREGLSDSVAPGVAGAGGVQADSELGQRTIGATGDAENTESIGVAEAASDETGGTARS